MSDEDLPPPLPGEIDREGQPPRDPIGDIQEWVRSYQEAPPHPPTTGRDMTEHTNQVAAPTDGGAWLYCSCGWEREIWSGESLDDLQRIFAEHVATSGKENTP